MEYDINNFVNEIADYQYSIDSTFWIITSSKAKYAYIRHLQKEYKFIASVSIDKVWFKKISKPNIYIYIYIPKYSTSS